ncbi:MAG: chromosome segregation protein SMC, partial [Cyclobacteriaceae bacterium]
SNIVDAIRWVLGEQKTRNLRSDKMENVIFNGTKNRKALQMAEVALTFNNTKNLLPTEYSTVTITRRYYRSGESEYMLNGVTCRLKDINTLFMDTGIGSDSYAIIELKMVDNILNDRENSRRTLFEEAAGISKFKIRKKQTLKKLDDTDKDLERVEDLLFEIEKNLKSLERQAKQAEKYLKIKEEYKSLSVELAKIKISSQRMQSDKLSASYAKENDVKLSLNKQIIELEADLEKQKVNLVKREKLLATRQKTLNDHVNKTRNYESEKKIRSERLRFLNDKAANLQELILQDQASTDNAVTDLDILDKERLSADTTLQEITKNLTVLEKERDDQQVKTAEVQQQLASNRAQLKAKQEEVFQLKKSLELSEQRLNTFREEVLTIEKSDSESGIHLQRYQDDVVRIAKILQTKEQGLGELQKEYEKTEIKIKEAEEIAEKLKKELNEINRKLDAKNNEYTLTKSMVDNLEGYPDAIKFLKKNSHWGHEAPLLSDILTCDEKYRLAIENYLEPYMNYYVVDDSSTAYLAVNLLQDASKGKAHFFILDSLEKSKTKTTPIDNCTQALEVAEYESKYANLLHHLLKDVYFVEDNHESLPEDKGITFLTINGKLIKRKHSISGGSVGLFEGKRIGRVKNLEKLKEDIKFLSKDQDKLKSKVELKQNEIATLKQVQYKESIDAIKEEINQLNQQYVSAKVKQEQMTGALENNANKFEDIQKNIQILESSILKSKPKVELEEVSLQNIEDQLAELSDKYNFQNEIFAQKSATFNQENILLHQQKNRLDGKEKEIEFKKQSIEESKLRIERNRASMAETEKETTQLMTNREDGDEDLIALYEEKNTIEEGVREAEKEYYENRGEIEEFQKKVREVIRQREYADEIILQLQEKLNESKLGLASIKERLAVEFEIDIDQLSLSGEEIENKEVDEEELTEKVLKLKDRLSNIGPINPMAMEAYKEIQERHEFIGKERADLDAAKNSLLSTISEIDQVAKETFTNTFEKIQENFTEVFRSLFTEEDTCSLKLSDPSNPLDSSIEIMAKPKGKRPLTINQLSGGEKTLTAVALLFAIYLIKPAPFCIFDEVDAPLDDANVDKFNNIIRKFSKQSQFIIVTHNKRTMASTDVIYGVTMQETGVSKLVPVDLRELE